MLISAVFAVSEQGHARRCKAMHSMARIPPSPPYSLSLRCGHSIGSNLGPIAAELGPKPGNTTQNKAKRTNEIDFISRLCKQGVTGSIPVTSTRTLFPSFPQLTLHFHPLISEWFFSEHLEQLRFLEGRSRSPLSQSR